MHTEPHSFWWYFQAKWLVSEPSEQDEFAQGQTGSSMQHLIQELLLEELIISKADSHVTKSHLSDLQRFLSKKHYGKCCSLEAAQI